jgi:5-methylcytosine-specific restriction endonuclease McrA
VSDRRYSTARWQRLRKAVLAHYGYVCQVEGPRCTGYATTVHHLIAQNTRQTIESLRALVVEQQQQIAEMAERLARHEHPKRPAIY